MITWQVVALMEVPDLVLRRSCGRLNNAHVEPSQVERNHTVPICVEVPQSPDQQEEGENRKGVI